MSKRYDERVSLILIPLPWYRTVSAKPKEMDIHVKTTSIDLVRDSATLQRFQCSSSTRTVIANSGCQLKQLNIMPTVAFDEHRTRQAKLRQGSAALHLAQLRERQLLDLAPHSLNGAELLTHGTVRRPGGRLDVCSFGLWQRLEDG